MVFLNYNLLQKLHSTSTAIHKKIYITVDDENKQKYFVGEKNGRLSEITDKKIIQDILKNISELGNNNNTQSPPSIDLSLYEEKINKSTNVVVDSSSNTKYPSVKSVYDWVLSLGYITSSALFGYATQSWVLAQGFITNVISSLGYIPENVANKSDNYTISSSITYTSTKALVDGLATKQDTLVSGTNIKTINGNSLLGSGNLLIEGLTHQQVLARTLGA